MTLYVLFGGLAIVVLWFLFTYNRLIVTAIKGAMEFERGTLTQVVDARAKAQTAAGPADSARKEGELTDALGRLFALAESYPALRSNENVQMLQEELASTENRIGFARQFYNDIATKYDIARQVCPANLVSSSLGVKTAERFELTDAAERAVPAVDLSMTK